MFWLWGSGAENLWTVLTGLAMTVMAVATVLTLVLPNFWFCIIQIALDSPLFDAGGVATA